MEITTTTARKISDGQVVFVKEGDSWMIAGPAKKITAGRTVTITKTSGQQSQVTVGEIVAADTYTSIPEHIYNIEYVVATIARPATAQAPRYRTSPARTMYARTARTGSYCQHCGERIFAGVCEGCGTHA